MRANSKLAVVLGIFAAGSASAGAAAGPTPRVLWSDKPVVFTEKQAANLRHSDDIWSREVNYWFVDQVNLSECFTPLAEWVDSIREVRKEETRKVLGVERGWLMRSENGVFGGSTYYFQKGDSAWISQNLWDHYAFTRDKEYLERYAYPVMKEISEFWLDHLKELPDGALVVPDGTSPEHGPQKNDDGTVTSTPEQHIPPCGFPGKMFEVCMTMNDTWGYKANDRNWKSPQRLIRMLSDIASKGGNLLLNIGPRADGSIPQESIDRLEAIARWMDINSGAIHATGASPFPRRLPWGRVTRKPTADGGTTLYLHVWDWPANGRILLPTLKELPSSGTMLKGGATVTAERTVDGVVVHLPGSATDPDVSVARLDFPGPLTITQSPCATPGADGTLTLLALDADPCGAVGGNILGEGSGAGAYLTGWKIPDYRVEYQVKTGKPGKWKVEAEVAAIKPARLALKVGESSQTIGIPATGDGLTWKTVPLGEIELPADEAVIELKPDPEHWNPIQLRTVTLTPIKK